MTWSKEKSRSDHKVLKTINFADFLTQLFPDFLSLSDVNLKVLLYTMNIFPRDQGRVSGLVVHKLTRIGGTPVLNQSINQSINLEVPLSINVYTCLPIDQSKINNFSNQLINKFIQLIDKQVYLSLNWFNKNTILFIHQSINYKFWSN